MQLPSLYTHPDCLRHLPGLGHPESPARLRVLLEALDDTVCRQVDGLLLPPEDEVLGTLAWIHSREYIERVREACKSGPATIDSQDCPVGPGSWEALKAASGLSLRAALDMASGRCRRAFVALRPPSHHAGREKASGYCYFNATALAAEVLCRASGRSVLVVDFDAHHGNGTQEHFWERGDIGFFSVHEYPAFPGSGAGDEEGAGNGRGATLNIPLGAEADDDMVCAAFDHGLATMAARIHPAAIVVSAGFSGHRDDPLSSWKLTETAYRRMTRAILQAAEQYSEGRVLSLLEGGYKPANLASSARAHVEELGREASADSGPGIN